jgi:hypothetical protein
MIRKIPKLRCLCVNSMGLAIGLLLLVPTNANPAVIGTATVTTGWTLVGPEHRVRPRLSYDSPRALFEEVWVDSTNVGLVLEATAESDTDFVAIASRLGNGTQDEVCVGTCEEISCSALCAPESLFFSLDTTDFSPATVKKVSLRIDELSFGLDSREGQIVMFTFTIIVEGDQAGVPARSISWGSIKARYH